MSNPPGITLTQETKELIINLIKIDTISKEQKYSLFTQLLELWKLDLATGSTPPNAFVDNIKFINQTILNTYDELERNADHVYRTLYQGLTYHTNNGATISSNALEVSRADARRKNVNKKVHRQFANLAREFDDFIKNKGIYFYKAKELTPVELPFPRKILPRNAKDSITYIGLGATTDEPMGGKVESAKVNIKVLSYALPCKVNFF